jgi:hypothetical protein
MIEALAHLVAYITGIEARNTAKVSRVVCINVRASFSCAYFADVLQSGPAPLDWQALTLNGI